MCVCACVIDLLSFFLFFFAMEEKGKQRGPSRGELGGIQEREINMSLFSRA